MQSSKIGLLLLTTLFISHTFGEEDETERRKGFGLVKKCIKTGMSPTGVEDLKTLKNLRNAGICLRNCQKEEDCQAWRFSKSNKTCDLFSGFDSFEGNKMFLSGTKECLKKGKEQIKKCRKKGMSPTNVEELETSENTTVVKCFRKCKNLEDCEAWRFSKQNKTCDLFSDFESFEENKMYISGAKECFNKILNEKEKMLKMCKKKGMTPTDVEKLSSFENVKKGGRCSRKCNKTEDCKAWRFSKGNKTCELFLSFESFESNDMYISGSKEDCMKS